MALMSWSDTLDVGIEDMNTDHKQILSSMNKLHELSLTDDHNTNKNLIDTELDKFIGIVKRHFADEEAFMRSIDFDGIESHILIHQKLLKDLIEYARAFKIPGGQLTEEFFDFLKMWLVTHIQGIDIKYGRARLK